MTDVAAVLCAFEADATQRLEAIMASDLSDLGQFSAARLQLRRANLDRTQIALDLCRHLIATTSSRHSLQDLQRQELDADDLLRLLHGGRERPGRQRRVAPPRRRYAGC